MLFTNDASSLDGRLLVHPGNTLRISWNPMALFPTGNPSNLRVNLTISQYNVGTYLYTSRTETVATLLINETNNGGAVITYPEISSLDQGGVVPVSIEVILTGHTQGSVPLQGAVQQVKLTSRVFYTSRDTSSYADNCEAWVQRQSSAINRSILESLVACPPTIDQALAPNSGLRALTAAALETSTSFFHGEDRACFRAISSRAAFG